MANIRATDLSGPQEIGERDGWDICTNSVSQQAAGQKTRQNTVSGGKEPMVTEQGLRRKGDKTSGPRSPGEGLEAGNQAPECNVGSEAEVQENSRILFLPFSDWPRPSPKAQGSHLESLCVHCPQDVVGWRGERGTW